MGNLAIFVPKSLFDAVLSPNTHQDSVKTHSISIYSHTVIKWIANALGAAFEVRRHQAPSRLGPAPRQGSRVLAGWLPGREPADPRTTGLFDVHHGLLL